LQNLFYILFAWANFVTKVTNALSEVRVFYFYGCHKNKFTRQYSLILLENIYNKKTGSTTMKVNLVLHQQYFW